MSIAYTSPQGVGAVQVGAKNETRLYSQNNDGSISEFGRVGAFNVAGPTLNKVLIPAGQVQIGTPIAATTTRDDFTEIHVFFFSPGPNSVLREWVSDSTGWNPGAVNALNFPVTPGSQALYALQNGKDIRVGFFSPGVSNGTLVEAIKQNGVWLNRLSPLPA
ncbi:hypothetical protein BD779DRAFT_1493456 [Infundibulicybe gibba]|nr:hypothetical protein BD779DRAFT_1493456 [Infundibulicybe gibba]